MSIKETRDRTKRPKSSRTKRALGWKGELKSAMALVSVPLAVLIVGVTFLGIDRAGWNHTVDMVEATYPVDSADTGKFNRKRVLIVSVDGIQHQCSRPSDEQMQKKERLVCEGSFTLEAR